VPVEQIGCLVHLLAFHGNAFWTGFRQPSSGFITVQVRPKKRAYRYRSLQSRLSHGFPYAGPMLP